MNMQILTCVDVCIANLLETYVHRAGNEMLYSLHSNVESFNELFVLIKEKKPDAVIFQVQVSYDLGGCMDFLNDLDTLDFMPAILVFEVRDNGNIVFTTTDDSLNIYAKAVADMFSDATKDEYNPVFTYFRHAEADEDPSVLEREEALEEILRGCSDVEAKEYIERFNFNLRGKGYYLFFWELQNAEFVYHFYNKNVYNMVGSILGKRYLQIINNFEGGEKIRLSLNRFCFIINAFTVNSEAAKYVNFEKMIKLMDNAGTCRTSISYISSKVNNLNELRIVRDLYEENKYCAFFLKYDGILREEKIQMIKKQQLANTEKIEPILKRIVDYIDYDCCNEGLVKELRHLYFDIIKPSINYTLYYYCSSVICFEMVKKEKTMDVYLLSSTLMPEFLRFTSIEEQFDILLKHLYMFQKKNANIVRNPNTITSEAVRYVKENYMNDINIPKIADAIHVSQSYLNQLFRKNMGMSVLQFITMTRIEEAKTTLVNTNWPVYYVSEHVGFGDVKHFSKLFKKMTGNTPTEYRNTGSYK